MRFFKHFSAIATIQKQIYLDYASRTPLDKAMLDRMPAIDPSYLGANPSAIHARGVALRSTLAAARTRVAKVFGAHDDEIIFTSCATESDNLALGGAIRACMADGMSANEICVYSSAFEHAAIKETVAAFERGGVKHIVMDTPETIVEPRDIVVLEGMKAVIVSVLYVHNEIGTVQPIATIAKRIRFLRKQHPAVRFVFHTDATQAPAHFPLDAQHLGVDLMTIGTTKLYCANGVGILYKKRSVKLVPLLYGGGQEFGLRPGTEPVALIDECSRALQYAQKIREHETNRVRELQTYFESEVKKISPMIKISAEHVHRTAHISHVAFPNFDSELMVLELDARGVAVSAKSACEYEQENQSAIVEKLYGTQWGAVRFSFGRMTRRRDIDAAVKAMRAVFEKYKKVPQPNH